jgi:hypothetical protein
MVNLDDKIGHQKFQDTYPRRNGFPLIHVKSLRTRSNALKVDDIRTRPIALKQELALGVIRTKSVEDMIRFATEKDMKSLTPFTRADKTKLSNSAENIHKQTSSTTTPSVMKGLGKLFGKIASTAQREEDRVNTLSIEDLFLAEKKKGPKSPEVWNPIQEQVQKDIHREK